MKRLQDFSFDSISVRTLQRGCLVLIAAVQFFMLVWGTYVQGSFSLSLAVFLNMISVFYAGASFRNITSPVGKKLFGAGLLFSAWVLLLQLDGFRDFENMAQYGPRFMLSCFLCDYLLMFTFAGIAEDPGQNRGLQIFGSAFLLSSPVFMVLSILLCANVVPASLQDQVKWIEVRLWTLWNSNILAGIFMITIGFLAMLIFTTRHKWVKILAAAMILPNFYFIALTNCRAVMWMTCLMLSGIVSFTVFDHRNFRSSFIKWASIISLGVLLFLLMVSLMNWFFAQHLSYVSSQLPELTKDAADVAVRRKSSENVSSLGGRFYRWKYIIEHGFTDLPVLVFGAGSIPEYLAPADCYHAHNSFLQTYLNLGLPGLLIALYLTYLAVKNAFILLFFRKSTMLQKVVSMLVGCLLVTQFFESYLFFADNKMIFFNATFLLCLGYMIRWVKEDSAEKTA